MKRLLLFNLPVNFVFFLSVFSWCDGGICSDVRSVRFKQGEMIVKFKQDVPDHMKDRIHQTRGFKLLKHFRKTGLQLVRYKEGLDIQDAIRIYRENPEVEYAEPNYELYALDTIPNDSRFRELWGLSNTGQTGGVYEADIDASEAWDTTTGDSQIIVAVIDTGVDYKHADLSDNMWINEAELNGMIHVDDDHNGYVDDIYGIDAYNDDTDPMDDHFHGTHCAGTVGAVGNNGIGVVGVNWNVRIMALKFLGALGSGYTDDAIRCIEYVTIMKHNYGENIRVASNSWGGGGYSQALHDAIQDAGDEGVLFVFAAGNSQMDNDAAPLYPGSYDCPSMITVAATDHNDEIAAFSCWGKTTVDVAAPGVGILSTEPGNRYGIHSGTSMATPHVSGLAALLWAAKPDLSLHEIRSAIFTTVDPLPSLGGLILTGGRINAKNALHCDSNFLRLHATQPMRGFAAAQGSVNTVSAFVGTCSSYPEMAVTVQFSNGEATISLDDSGQGADSTANDGLYTGMWTPETLGNVTLTFTATSSGGDVVTDEVSGGVGYLVADFSADVTRGDSPLVVQFTDLSEGAPGVDSRLWNFGDGWSSTETNPTHIYDSQGLYTVSLTVFTTMGEQSLQHTEAKVDYVNVTAPLPVEILSINPIEAVNDLPTEVVIAGRNFLETPRVSIYGGGPHILGSCMTPKSAYSACVSGHYAYVADFDNYYSRLHVVDINDLRNPVIVGSCDIPSQARDVKIDGHYAYVANSGAGLTVVDTSVPESPRVVGSCDTPGNAVGVFVKGDYAYIADSGTGIQIADIGNPVEPHLAGACDTPGNAVGVYVQDHIAYVADSLAGLQVVNVTNPSQPFVTGSCDTPRGANGVHAIAGFVYVADYAYGFGSALQVIDARNSTNPILLGACDLPGASVGVYASGDYAYVADYGAGVQIIDIHDPETPLKVAACDTPGYARSVWVVNDVACVADTYDLKILDVSSLLNPSIAGACEITGEACDVDRSGAYAYVAQGTGLQVVDISNPVAPLVVHALDTPGNAHGVCVSGQYAYVADGSALQVVDIGTPMSPRIVGACEMTGGAMDVFVSGGYAYVADSGAGLKVLDIGNPVNPIIVGNCDTPSDALGVYVLHNHAYVANYLSGLQIINIGSPDNPYITGSCDTPGFARCVYATEGYAFVGDYGHFNIIAVSDPANPYLAGRCDVVGDVRGIQVLGEFAYVAESSGLQVINVSNPARPSVVGACRTPGQGRGLCLSESNIYLADFTKDLYSISSLNVMRLFEPCPKVSWSDVSISGDSEIEATISASLFPGTYDLFVTNPNGSFGKLSNAFKVLGQAPIPAPKTDFMASTTNGTAPLTVEFTDHTLGDVCTCSWTFGDGGKSTVRNPVYTYAVPGVYDVCLTVMGAGGSDSATKNDYIHVTQPIPPLEAEFLAEPTYGVAPLGVQFTDLSTGQIASREWNFGDGQTSAPTALDHTYVSPGTYTVSLTVTGPDGSMSMKTKTDYIHVEAPVAAPEADFTAAPMDGPAPLFVTFTDSSTGDIHSWKWDFGDGYINAAKNTAHAYVEPGTYTVTLTVEGAGGSDTAVKTGLIRVSGTPTPIVENLVPPACYPNTIVEIHGKNFGATQGTSLIHIAGQAFGSGHSRIKLWSNTMIKVKIPFGAKACTWYKDGGRTFRAVDVSVSVGGATSKNVGLSVLKPTSCP